MWYLQCARQQSAHRSIVMHILLFIINVACWWYSYKLYIYAKDLQDQSKEFARSLRLAKHQKRLRHGQTLQERALTFAAKHDVIAQQTKENSIVITGSYQECVACLYTWLRCGVGAHAVTLSKGAPYTIRMEVQIVPARPCTATHRNEIIKDPTVFVEGKL